MLNKKEILEREQLIQILDREILKFFTIENINKIIIIKFIL